jgi:hypothetical protein
LDKEGQARWYKFHIEPNSKLIVKLTGLPANYDLTVYKDISATFQALNAQALDSVQDLNQLGAEFAPDSFSPDSFSPDSFSPDSFSPDSFSTDSFSPDSFSPDSFSPDSFSADAFTPDSFSPDSFSPDSFSPDSSALTVQPGSFSLTVHPTIQSRFILRRRMQPVGVSAFDGTHEGTPSIPGTTGRFTCVYAGATEPIRTQRITWKSRQTGEWVHQPNRCGFSLSVTSESLR